MNKSIVSLSGGADSAVSLALSIESGREVRAAFGFFYNSKHNVFENTCARRVANHYGIPFELIDISGALKSFRSSLMKGGEEIPEGNYDSLNMSSTVVPCRNLIFAAILGGLADSFDCNEIVLGVHGGDHFIYPDCREETIRAMECALKLGTDGRVNSVFTPIQNMNKIEVIREGLRLKVPFEMTRTCYKDQLIACGKCGSCRERREAFHANGIEDPIEYEK